MNVYSGNARSAKIGLAAIVATWAASGLTVPIIKVLRPHFSAEELLFVRSLFSVTVSFAIARSKVWQSDWRMKAAGAIIGFSSIAFYRALQIWDVNPVMVIVAIVPAINIVIAFLEGKRVRTIVVVSFILLMFGKVGKMNTAVASVLLQVTTPCTIIGAYFWSGERLDGFQWLGVAIALSGAAILSVWTTHQEHEQP